MQTSQKAILSLVGLIAVMAAILFVSAGTLNYWQAWTFLAVYAVMSLATILYLAHKDPALLERRMKGGPFAEKEPTQKVIMSLTSLGFICLLVIPALDNRFGWSQMPAAIAIAGDALILLGWLAICFVFRENTFTAATIEVAPDQKVITSGPYAIVRHPMYAGGSFMLAGIPIALGSWWGLLVIAAMMPALIWRLLDEERLLTRDLQGYAEYQGKVRFRLIPFVW